MKIKFKKRYILYAAIISSLTLLALSGTIMSQVNEPQFNIIQASGNIEIREYKPVIVAQVVMGGERKEAISAGFRVLADYIFGNNSPQQKIPMTAPITQQAGKKIAMTAPVIQQKSPEKGNWKIRFVMPSNYTLDTLPQPNDQRVEVLAVPEKLYAVIRFSGLSSHDNLESHLEELRTYLKEQNLRPIDDPVMAFYNPPWTLPFLRRNEVMIEISPGG
ncbi:MAG: heme-binding protein [Alphaproteobacteria bacterium]|nr:heme-binding protein [Alphaproteobacteria bacterium]